MMVIRFRGSICFINELETNMLMQLAIKKKVQKRSMNATNSNHQIRTQFHLAFDDLIRS